MAKRKNLALRKNKSEVIAMSIFEYDKEEEERKLRKAEYEAGREEGIKEGMKEYDRFMKLTQKLLSDKQYDELKRATEEKSYCQQLFEKYNII